MEQAEIFGRHVREKAEEIGAKQIWNADEIAMFFDMAPKYTLETKGTKTVWIRGTGLEKRRVSVLLLGSMSGEKKVPFVVFKALSNNKWKTSR